MRIGVLAMQGAFAEHIAVLKRLGVETVEVRLPEQLEKLDGLIIPGGESTSITKLMRHYELTEKLHRMATDNFPMFGTCAGMIVLAKGVVNGKITPIGVMEISVKRNAFGRQVDSFETDIRIPAIGKNKFHAVFIRAPLIASVGEKVEILAKLKDGTVIAARQDKLLVTAFHPELTDDTRLHEYFLDIVSGKI
jgi:5'-phosphate synthase pdxT subunit